MVEQVGSIFDVRVHEVRPTRDGGAVIRTPSVAERRKIVDNKKFGEVGLEMSIKDKLGPKVTVQRVHAEISPDEFMEELYSMNLKDMFSTESYRRSVRLASGPWKVGGCGQVNVTLECTARMAEHLRTTDVYIKWFRFVVRTLEAIPACSHCVGFAHRVRDCRMKEDVCGRCGTTGHVAFRCPELRCRNCAFKACPQTTL